MIAFEVRLNGKKHCVAGLPGPGVVSIIMNRVAGEGKRSRPANELLGLSVAGLDSITQEHMNWFRRQLKTGDKITVRVVDVEKADPLSKDSKKPMADAKWKEKAYVRRKAREFGWKIKSK